MDRRLFARLLLHTLGRAALCVAWGTALPVAILALLGPMRHVSVNEAADISFRAMMPWFLPGLAGVVLAAAVSMTVLAWPVAASTAVEAGKERWARMSIQAAVGFAVFAVHAVLRLVEGLVVGDSLPGWVPKALFAVNAAAVVLMLAAVRPSRERVHYLETGDVSRTRDERAQQVRDRAARTTLVIFAAILLVGGVAYEVLIERVWPFGTLLAAGGLWLVWAGARAYWDHRR